MLWTFWTQPDTAHHLRLRIRSGWCSIVKLSKTEETGFYSSGFCLMIWCEVVENNIIQHSQWRVSDLTPRNHEQWWRLRWYRGGTGGLRQVSEETALRFTQWVLVRKIWTTFKLYYVRSTVSDYALPHASSNVLSSFSSIWMYSSRRDFTSYSWN